MKKRIVSLMVLIFLISIPSMIKADGIKSIIIVVDEMSLDMASKLFEGRSSIGLMNLKTRGAYSEENLYLSINKGRKLGKNDLKNIGFLGDSLKEEKTSYIGRGKEKIILWDKEESIDYEENSIMYDSDWLIENTENMLKKSNILAIGYDLEDKLERVHILNQYLEHYKGEQIIILPKAISKEDENLLNKSLVPIIYINNKESGLLTSLSTKRNGFIALEDISVQLKNTYGYFNKVDIGNSFEIIEKKDPLKKINNLYKVTMNILIITYIFHGLLYLSQIVLGIYILRKKRINKWIGFLYLFSTISILTSLILGFFELHKNIWIYLLISTLITYIVSMKAMNKENELINKIIIGTYGLIIFGIILYPKMIYNSYIGFNNIVYGARYYGLNNGIAGVLLATSIISFFTITRNMENRKKKRVIGIVMFGLNVIALSTSYGANTGGFITSIILFISMMYMILFFENHSIKKMILFLLTGVSLFILNMLIDNMSGDKSHAIEFFYRLKENGFREFIYMGSFKLRELIVLTLTPPFSIVLLFQGIILSYLRKHFMEYEEIKKEAIIIILTSLIGFLINDTGMIMLIYMLNYFILYIITNKIFME